MPLRNWQSDADMLAANMLGRGCLDPALEASLVEDGFAFATVLIQAGEHSGRKRRKHPLILCGRRCPVAASVDMETDARRVLRTHPQDKSK